MILMNNLLTIAKNECFICEGTRTRAKVEKKIERTWKNVVEF